MTAINAEQLTDDLVPILVPSFDQSYELGYWQGSTGRKMIVPTGWAKTYHESVITGYRDGLREQWRQRKAKCKAIGDKTFCLIGDEGKGK